MYLAAVPAVSGRLIMELYKLIALVNGFNYVGMLPIMLWLPVIFQ